MSSSASSQAWKNMKMQPIAHTEVTFEDAFWGPRLETVRTQTLPFIYEQMKQDGHFTAFREEWQAGMRPIPYVFWESDISKWIEAASYSLATHPDEGLAALVDEAIAFLLSLQQPDGYLNLWFTQVEPDKRWSNLRDLHELYCAGHLIEAACAHFQATGKRELLDAACRYADYIDQTFGPQEGKRRGYCGHEEIELALSKLFHVTGEQRYFQLSHYFIEERGRQPHYFDEEARARGENPAEFWAGSYEYNQSHLLVREQREVVGHAVREMYLLCAVADLARELPDEELQQVCERLWSHLCSKRLYVTAGLGSAASNEGFTADYDLPNLHAYAETCAGIGLIMWAHRMLLLDANRRYSDILELSLYNGVLSSIGLDGKSFFYVNPLESHGDHHHQPWFKCACCPPNIARLLLSLGTYLYSVSETAIFVHLYAQSTTKLSVGTHTVSIHQQTNYPWDGRIQFALEMSSPAEFGLNVRIPGWCKDAHLTIAGRDVPLDVRKGYAHIMRQWQPGESVVLELSMPAERVYAHPLIREDAGSVALQRGPLVYCLEAVDNINSLHELLLPEDATLTSHFEPALLNGVTVITAQGLRTETSDWDGLLYRTTPPLYHTQPLTAIPYYVWDQRAAGEMRVWLRSLKQ